MQRVGARVNIAGRERWPGWSPGCGADEDHGEAEHEERQRRDGWSCFASFYRTPADPGLLLEEWGLTRKRDSAFDTLSGR